MSPDPHDPYYGAPTFPVAALWRGDGCGEPWSFIRCLNTRAAPTAGGGGYRQVAGHDPRPRGRGPRRLPLGFLLSTEFSHGRDTAPGAGLASGRGYVAVAGPWGVGRTSEPAGDWWRRFDRRLLRGEQCSQAPKEGAVWGRVGQGGSCRLRERDAAGEAKRHRSYLEGPCCVDWHPRQLENPTGRRR